MNRRILARRGALTGAVLISGCLLLTACGGGGSSSASSGSAIARAPAAAGAGSAGYGAPASAAQPAVRSGAQAAVQTARLAPASQSIIYTASLTVRSPNVTQIARQAVGIAVAAGGYVSAEHANSGTPGKTGRTVQLELKIPVPAYQVVLGKLSSPGLGKQLSLQQQASDVTQQVADVGSLVTSEEAAIRALQGLLSHAGSVSGLLQVQQQISSDSSTLNALLAQQRALDHETAYATVSMSLVSPKPHAAVAGKGGRHGFIAGLSAGWRALRHATAWVLTALGAALPFLIIIVVLGSIGYGTRRRILRRRTGPTAAG